MKPTVTIELDAYNKVVNENETLRKVIKEKTTLKNDCDGITILSDNEMIKYLFDKLEKDKEWYVQRCDMFESKYKEEKQKYLEVNARLNKIESEYDTLIRYCKLPWYMKF